MTAFSFFCISVIIFATIITLINSSKYARRQYMLYSVGHIAWLVSVATIFVHLFNVIIHVVCRHSIWSEF